MSKFTGNILKSQQHEVKEDKYKTGTLSISEKLGFYDKKLKEFQKVKNFHKNEYQKIKLIETNSVNILQFKLDENNKKMSNEINRLKQEESRHKESQQNESKRIQAQIDFLKDNNKTISNVLDDFLNKVVNLENTIGPK